MLLIAAILGLGSLAGWAAHRNPVPTVAHQAPLGPMTPTFRSTGHDGYATAA